MAMPAEDDDGGTAGVVVDGLLDGAGRQERLGTDRGLALGEDLGPQLGGAGAQGVPVDVQGGQRHGAVDVDGDGGRQDSVPAQIGELVEDDLGAIDREGGDDDGGRIRSFQSRIGSRRGWTSRLAEWTIRWEPRNMAGEIRVVVADRRRSVAEVLALGLRQVGMVGSAVTGMKAACRAAGDDRADVVVADIGLLASPGLAVAVSPWPGRLAVPLIVLSDGTRTDDLACAAIRSGVRGWVSKDSSMQHLLAVIRGVQRGETWIPPPLLTRVLAELVTMRDGMEEDTGRLANLTARER
ncbi:hypothetical protein ACQFX6_39870 [Streptomyces sp. DSM 41987]|uniref:hypothetical protein n=1 Tax=Streptomyces TaxID=1883 RepID=UPI00361483B0